MLPLGIDRTRTVRGALSGVTAAAVWAALQPLDKAVARSDYDDVALLGTFVTRGDGWYPVGLAWHLLNGAAFGAAYANVAPALPIPAPLRAPALVLTENFGTWPLAFLVDRFHPARDRLPALRGNRAALAQATWRHLLFGVVLGELERRLNTAPEPAPPAETVDHSSNGYVPLRSAESVTIEVIELPGSDE